MDTAVLVAIISFSGIIIGYGMNLIGTKMNNKAQQKRENEKFQRDIDLKEIEEERKSNKERIKAITEIIELLSYFEHAISLTSSYMDTIKEISLSQHHDAYREERKKLHRLISLVCVYTPDCYNKICTMEGNHNLYWGRQGALLGIDIKKNEKEYVEILDTVVQVSHECSKNITDLIYDLRELSKRLLPSSM